MDLADREEDRLGRSLAPFVALAGDRRTGRLTAATMRDIVGARIAALSPSAGRRPA